MKRTSCATVRVTPRTQEPDPQQPLYPVWAVVPLWLGIVGWIHVVRLLWGDKP